MFHLFIYLIIIILINNMNYLILKYHNHKLCISLVIPSTNYSWSKCHKQIEYMICNSIAYPKEVIVLISYSSYNQKAVYNVYCNYKITLLYRIDKSNSASNKNYGSKYSHCSYISYFDSDDIMSKYRIVTLLHILKHLYKYDIILHYSRNYTIVEKNEIKLNNISREFYLSSSYITNLCKNHIASHKVKLWGCCHFLPIKYHISNGCCHHKDNYE